VLIGHALHNDLSVLKMEHVVPPERRRDTSRSLQLRELAGLAHRPVASLKALSLAILGQLHICTVILVLHCVLRCMLYWSVTSEQVWPAAFAGVTTDYS